MEALLAAMTLEEKPAQLGSCWPRELNEDANVAPLQDTLARGADCWEQARERGLGHLTRPVGTRPVEPQDGVQRFSGAAAGPG